MESPHISVWQLALQPSLSVALPSSQVSPHSSTLFPQTAASSVWQLALHPSHELVLPSSQVSPTPIMLSPHTAAQALLDAVVSQQKSSLCGSVGLVMPVQYEAGKTEQMFWLVAISHSMALRSLVESMLA
jgi:hypothetical protein